jgi:hypothetical protein
MSDTTKVPSAPAPTQSTAQVQPTPAPARPAWISSELREVSRGVFIVPTSGSVFAKK